MSATKLVNNPDELVDQALDGVCTAHPDLVRRHPGDRFLVRSRAKAAGRVALVSGGGSGHEPLHTGFVGAGMLDAAVPGAVFASPTAGQVSAATAAVHAGAGVLHVVKNYTGDVLNFGLAADLAVDDGVAVETVLVDDDLATDPGGDTDGPGRRGTAAVVAVEKICGAAAEAGVALPEVAALGRRVVAGSRTLALALAACVHPGRDRPSFDLSAGEVEFGVGIHGERGIGRRPVADADELVAALVEPVVAALGLHAGDRVLAITNGLGATHPLELYLAHSIVARVLGEQGIVLDRSLVGSYVTALDMAGCSVTLVRLDEELRRWWDAPVRTAALTW